MSIQNGKLTKDQIRVWVEWVTMGEDIPGWLQAAKNIITQLETEVEDLSAQVVSLQSIVASQEELLGSDGNAKVKELSSTIKELTETVNLHQQKIDELTQTNKVLSDAYESEKDTNRDLLAQMNDLKIKHRIA